MGTHGEAFPCSPGLYPREGIRAAIGAPYPPRSEILFFDRLRSALPAGWYAWHSLKLCVPGQEFAEADFVIAVPDRGLLVIEIKGGEIRKEKGIWLQNGYRMIPSPLDQAYRTKKVLLDRFEAHQVAAPWISLAVCFPDTPVDASLTQDDLAGRVFGSEALPYLESALAAVAENDFRHQHHPLKGWVALVHSFWCESWIPKRNLSVRKREDEEIRLRLDRDQLRTLDCLAQNDRVIVRGGAGTGKTILAMEMARREAAAGRRVLVLCFTEALGLELARVLDHPGITASSIGAFAVRLLREAGREVVEEYTPEFWKPVTLEAAFEALPAKERLWDTVIVDEAQDMGENDWLFIDAAAANASRLWAFHDPGQAFLSDRKIPESYEKSACKALLDRPYRCPPPIQALVEILSGGSSDRAILQEGMANGILKVIGGAAEEVDRLIGREIAALLEEGFTRPDIAVLSLRGLAFPDNIINRILIGRETYCRASDEKAREDIIGDTFLRFKGLERPAVIVTDVRHVEDRMAERLLIAVSRATSVLRIIDEVGALKKVKALEGLVG